MRTISLSSWNDPNFGPWNGRLISARIPGGGDDARGGGDSVGGNYPNKFDREGVNYWLGNAVCEHHWDKIVASGGLSKDTKTLTVFNSRAT